MDLVTFEQRGTFKDLWFASSVLTENRWVWGSSTTGVVVSPVVGEFDLWQSQPQRGTRLLPTSPITWSYEGATTVYAQVRVLVKKSEEVHTERLTLSLSDRIVYIRARLGLSVSDLAKIFGVDRQAVYGWSNASYAPTPDKLAKLEIIYYAAQLSTQYLNSASQDICHQQAGEKGTLLAALSVDSIDLSRVREIFKLLPETQQEQRRAKMRRGSLRDALRRQGMDDSPLESGVDQIDLVTGKIRSR